MFGYFFVLATICAGKAFTSGSYFSIIHLGQLTHRITVASDDRMML
jgi:hypothetical protein